MLKKLLASLLFKLSSLFVGTFLLLFFISYALLNKFLIEHMTDEKLVSVMSDFNEVWFLIGFVFIVLFITSFFIMKSTLSRVTDEIDEINKYLQAINEKRYDAVLRVDNYLEFLQLSLLLKNLVKRLKNKKK